jgi:hypothetical protein
VSRAINAVTNNKAVIFLASERNIGTPITFKYLFGTVCRLYYSRERYSTKVSIIVSKSVSRKDKKLLIISVPAS